MSTVGADADLLGRIERYFDAVPRSAADAEQHGALTLFVSRVPWRFYGRPRLGLADDVGADDVAAVRARQRELGVPERLEWVHETTPSLAGAAAAAGLVVTRVPLLALDAVGWERTPAPAGTTLRMLRADDPALAPSQAAVDLAFGDPGTARGAAGPGERDRAARPERALRFLRERMRAGNTAIAVAETAAEGVLASGSHQPSGPVSEITGVGTLPAARRRGLGRAVAGRLVEDARERGAEVVFLSAADDDVARLYEDVGFRRVGTAAFGRTEHDA